jgi:hypothetical protein
MDYDGILGKQTEPEETDHTENGQDTYLGKVSAYELPTSEGVESTYAIVSSIDQEDNWILGKIDDTYLSLNHFLMIDSNNYRVSVNDNTYRMIVNIYNQNSKNIGYTDVSNGDILNLDPSVSYITITIYKYANRQRVDHSNQDMLSDLNNGLKFSITKIENLDEHIMDKELLTAEANIETLSNYYNYRTGWFKSWGGVYENRDGSLCTRNFYKVDDKPYIFNVNDSRILLSISEYDANGKWVKFNGGLTNGNTFTKQKSTSFIGLTIRSQKWGVDLYQLFENGLRMDLASEKYIDNTGTINFNDADLSDVDRWKEGAYLYETGEFIIDKNKIRYESFCRMDDKEYVVKLPGGYLKMNILELDQNGKALVNNNYQSGQKWKKANNTDKIAITVYGNNKTFTLEEYQKFISDYPTFGLEEYIKYSHNTVMKDISAGDFINAVNVGWNLGNALDSTSSTTDNLMQEVNWGNPYIIKDLMDYVAESGFNTIRIPVTWFYNSYRDENGYLKINAGWLNRVQDVVDYAIANHMYVIINSHHDQKIIYAGTDDVKMKQVIADAKALWTDIAEHFKTYDEHLIFESYNEVDNIEKSWNYSDKAALQMNELNQIFVDTVRGTGDNNINRILIVPTLLDGADSRFYSGFRMPEDTVANKIVVELHTYSKKFIQDIESDFTEMEEFSNGIKAPIIIGEFGSTTSYPLPELRSEHASNFVARAAEHGIKCIWWDNGSEYKIIDRRDYSASNMEMIKALLEGASGIGYQVEQVIVLNKPEQFVYLTPNIKTGKLEYTYWGTLTTDLNKSALPVKGGPICSLSLKAINEAAGIWLQRLLFYDTAGVLVQTGKEIQSKYYIGSVPDLSATARVSFNSPNISISLDNYNKYLNNGSIELSIGFFSPNDVKRVQLIISQHR